MSRRRGREERMGVEMREGEKETTLVFIMSKKKSNVVFFLNL